LTNSLKHSNGNHIDIYLNLEDAKILMVIHDNSKNGMDKIPAAGLGVSNMKMRSKKINGSVSIDNTVGFKVVLTVPVTSL